MTFSQAIFACLQHYAVFDGRASRSEFWWFVLFFVLTQVMMISLAMFFDILLYPASDLPPLPDILILLMVFGLVIPSFLLVWPLALVLTIPLLAVSARRLHDIGMSGWWNLLYLVPFLSVTLLAWLSFTPRKTDSPPHQMAFNQAVRTCFHKYAVFSGRASRAEFWWFNLFIVLATGAFVFVERLIEGLVGQIQEMTKSDIITFSDVVVAPLFVWMTTAIPNYTVAVRRLHDIGLSGWWILLSIPATILGLLSLEPPDLPPEGADIGEWLIMLGILNAVVLGIITLSLYCMKSDAGANPYGPEPGRSD